MVVKNTKLEHLTEEEHAGHTSRGEKKPTHPSIDHDYSDQDQDFQEDTTLNKIHKSFGEPPEEGDLQDRIDSSDQDEDASYEELNEEDLKTHSSGKLPKSPEVQQQQQEQQQEEEEYSEDEQEPEQQN